MSCMQPSPRVLVVEDEIFLADAIGKALTRANMRVHVLYDGRSALEYVDTTPIDVLVLDRDLPEVHGDEVCAEIIAEHPNTRVIMLTAAAKLDDLLSGFEAGADDYLTKPFEVPELVARIHALLRRSDAKRNAVVCVGDVVLDGATRRVTRAGKPIQLSPKEFAVLELLMRADGAVISSEELLARAWDSNADPFSNSIRVTISHLRSKLGKPWIVQTLSGAGYYAAEEKY